MNENRILVEKNSKLDTIIANVVSYTIDTKTMCQMLIKKGKLIVRCGSFNDDVPVFILLKAFGMEADQEVFQNIDCT